MLEDVWLYLSSMAVRYLPHDCPLVEVQNTNTAVRAGEERQEREELVDAGETRHRLAVLHTEQLPQLVLTGVARTVGQLEAVYSQPVPAGREKNVVHVEESGHVDWVREHVTVRMVFRAPVTARWRPVRLGLTTDLALSSHSLRLQASRRGAVSDWG